MADIDGIPLDALKLATAFRQKAEELNIQPGDEIIVRTLGAMFLAVCKMQDLDGPAIIKHMKECADRVPVEVNDPSPYMH